MAEERWHYLDPEELRAELDANWPPSVPRPTKAAVSADGRRWAYGNDTARGGATMEAK